MSPSGTSSFIAHTFFKHIRQPVAPSKSIILHKTHAMRRILHKLMRIPKTPMAHIQPLGFAPSNQIFWVERWVLWRDTQIPQNDVSDILRAMHWRASGRAVLGRGDGGRERKSRHLLPVGRKKVVRYASSIKATSLLLGGRRVCARRELAFGCGYLNGGLGLWYSRITYMYNVRITVTTYTPNGHPRVRKDTTLQHDASYPSETACSLPSPCDTSTDLASSQ
jgi:hypothetical protein